ncbi:aldolase [Granulicella sibirica]|uniref:HPr kinase n=1 Tax=Granulicella sibirica TaxID=2479048 RepID=A0A4Q0STD1_9BACT|nr:aldolase [Granulicella sibirica]RXH54205.1 hypothetical protein GRAN_4856 [Granulicella sibirica]
MPVLRAETATRTYLTRQQERLRHPLEGPPPTLKQRFFPFGFPVDVFTNSAAVLKMLEEMWRPFTARFPKDPIRCDIVVEESSETRCPPPPAYHLLMPLVTTICDGNNFSVVDVERSTVRTHITEAALRYPLFVRQHLLTAAYSCICTRYVTPIHGACVSWNSRGILLCGDSGAGKSTLAYACAHQGWIYTSDDASYLMNEETSRRVTGNCHQVRLRPESASLFPEISPLKLTARIAGKPSVEVPTNTMKDVTTSPTADVDYVIFLNRNHNGPAALVSSSPVAARESMGATLYGIPRMLDIQYRAIDRLLTAPVYELRYQTLDDAIRLLRWLAEEGENAERFIAAR